MVKLGFDLYDLDLWPLTLTFSWTSLLSLIITPENFMMIRWWEHSEKGVTDRRTDGRTDWTIHRGVSKGRHIPNHPNRRKVTMAKVILTMAARSSNEDCAALDKKRLSPWPNVAYCLAMTIFSFSRLFLMRQQVISISLCWHPVDITTWNAHTAGRHGQRESSLDYTCMQMWYCLVWPFPGKEKHPRVVAMSELIQTQNLRNLVCQWLIALIANEVTWDRDR